MILNKESYDRIMNTVGLHYNKIILADLSTDTYDIVKIESEEYDDPKRPDRLSEWFKSFSEGILIDPSCRDRFKEFTSIENFRRLKKSRSISYRKFVGLRWHDVRMDIYPISPSETYICIEDITAISGEVIETSLQSKIADLIKIVRADARKEFKHAMDASLSLDAEKKWHHITNDIKDEVLDEMDAIDNAMDLEELR